MGEYGECIPPDGPGEGKGSEMANNRIVLTISDDEIAALDEIATVLDEVAQMIEYEDRAEETDKINTLYAVLYGLRERIGREVLAS